MSANFNNMDRTDTDTLITSSYAGQKLGYVAEF